MKRIAFIGITIILFSSCNQNQQKMVYTQQSPETESFKEVLEAYEELDWEKIMCHNADIGKIRNNITERKERNSVQKESENKDEAGIFSGGDLGNEHTIYETIKTYGRIEKEICYLDTSKILKNLKALEEVENFRNGKGQGTVLS